MSSTCRRSVAGVFRESITKWALGLYPEIVGGAVVIPQLNTIGDGESLSVAFALVDGAAKAL